MKFFSNITLFISALALAPSAFSSPATIAGRLQQSFTPLKKYYIANIVKRVDRKDNVAAHQENVANGDVYNLQKSFMSQKVMERQVNQAAHEKKLANGDVYKIDDVIGHLESNNKAKQKVMERQVNRAAHKKKLANGDVYKIDDVIGHLEAKPAMSRNKKIVAGAVGGLAVAGLVTLANRRFFTA